MKKITLFYLAVLILGISTMPVTIQAQVTLPVPPKTVALSTWQMFRGGQEHHAQQLQKGGFTAATPVLKWEYTAPPGTGGGGEGEPAVGDINANGITEVVSAFKSTVNAVIGSTGALLWAYTTGGQINGSPAIGDVDNNGTQNVVVCSDKVYALNGATGTVLWSFTGAPVKSFNSSPEIADVVLGGAPEVIVTCDNGKVYCLNGTNGTVIWSYTIINTTESFWASPVVGDINKDGQPDVVVVSPAAFSNAGGEVIAFNGNNGTVIWKYTNAGFRWDIIPQSPAIGDLNQDCQPDVLAPQGGTLYNINGSTGALQWSKAGAGSASPALADMDGDCDLEIILGGPRILDFNGNQVYNGGGGGSGWNAPAPRVGDFNPTSPGLEIVLGTAYDQTGNVDIITMWSSTCVKLWGFRRAGHTTEGMCVADIDNDGCVEVVFNPDCCNGTSSVIALDDIAGAANCGYSAFPSNAGLTTLTPNPCVGACVTYTNLSSPCATAWAWDFPGGTPGTSTAYTPPAICYNGVGSYTARIIATFGNCAPVKKDTAYLPIVVKTCGPTVAAVGGSVCPGVCLNVTATGSGGTGPYTYSWAPGPGTGSSFNVCPATTTTYTVITTDGASATASNTTVVTVNTAPSPTISGTQTICAGQTTTLTATAGGTYAWNTGPTTAAITVTPAVNTTYTVIVTNGGCTGSKTVAVTVNPLPAPTIGGVTTICSGQSTTLTATAGGTYAWNTGPTTAAITVSPAVNTTYTVIVTNGGCTGSATVGVTVAAGLSPTIAGTTAICPGGSTTLTANSGGTYAWDNGATTAAITVSPASATTYTVTVTSGTCTGTATVAVTITAPPVPTITGTMTICAGQSTTLTGTSGVSYSWNTGATTTAITVSPAVNTTYTLTATNAGGCTGSITAAVTVNPLPAPTIGGMTTICAGQSTTLTATAGGTYAWSTGDVTAAATVTPASTSTYTVVVTTGGCTGSATVQVTVAANLIPVITGNTTVCNGTGTILSTSGGGTYAWSDGTTNASISVSPTTPTSYSVTVTNGTCSGTATVQVSVVNNPTPTITGNTSVCPGTSTTLTGNGGTTYVWDNGATTPSITVSPASQTTYTVTASTSGCTGVTTVVVTITAPPIPTITGNTAICNGSSTTLTGNGGTIYSWSTGATTAAITVSPTITSTYTVIVTTGCSASTTVQVTVQPTLVATITGNNTICDGTGTTLSTSGGGTYAWSDGSNGQTITVSPTVPTTYTVTVTNGLCSGTASRAVAVTPNPAPTISGTTTICSGTGTTLTATAGGTYAWNNGAATAAITVSPAISTTYTVTVTTNGCTGTATVGVTVNQTPAPTIPGPTTICSGQGTTLTSSTSGPYIWSTGATTNSITVSPTAASTTYTVSVTVNGCTGTAGQTVIVVPPVIATIQGKDICLGQSVTLTAGGGNNYMWHTGATVNPLTDSPVSTTTYTVIASVGSCADTATFTVTVNTLPTPTASGDTTISYGGSAQLKSSGGGTYTWIPPSGLSCTGCANPVATPRASTQYCVIVKNTAGCTDTACVMVVLDTKCGDNGELYVPNGFSPNGDGQNDVLFVRGGGVTEIYWAIYDRWGERVFETTDPKQGWDGVYKGKNLDPAVFVYYLKVTCFSGNEIIQKGNVAIIK